MPTNGSSGFQDAEVRLRRKSVPMFLCFVVLAWCKEISFHEPFIERVPEFRNSRIPTNDSIRSRDVEVPIVSYTLMLLVTFRVLVELIL